MPGELIRCPLGAPSSEGTQAGRGGSAGGLNWQEVGAPKSALVPSVGGFDQVP
jgi:hypothetical protein